VAKTLEAALAAELPAGCARTVYLLDDGKQRDKRKWCAAAGPAARAWRPECAVPRRPQAAPQ